MIQEIYTDTTYVDNMKIINSWDGEEYYLSMHLLNSKMQDLIYRNDEIAGIALIGKYGDECYYDRITKSDQESICFEEHMGNNMLVKQALTKKDSVYSALLGKEDPEYGSHSFFYIAHQLTDFNNYEKGAVGCVVICIDEEKFRSTLQSERKRTVCHLLLTDMEILYLCRKRDLKEVIFMVRVRKRQLL